MFILDIEKLIGCFDLLPSFMILFATVSLLLFFIIILEAIRLKRAKKYKKRKKQAAKENP